MRKEIPILFSTPMVQAILDGRKTMTRRAIKPQPDQEGSVSFMANPPLDWKGEWYPWKWDTSEGESIAKNCPYGHPGDIMWVRESFQEYGGCIFFKADGPEINEGPLGCANKWKPSIHMPKSACRIWLEVINVRVERLHDITPGAACDEGIEYWNIDGESMEGGELQADFKNYTWTEKKENDPNYNDRYFPTFANPVDSFRTLWQSINGFESWEANPWVWVIEFKQFNKIESI